MKTKIKFPYLCMIALFTLGTILLTGCKGDEESSYLIQYIDGNTNFKSNMYIQSAVNAKVREAQLVTGTEKNAVDKFNALCDGLENTKYNGIPLLGETTCTLGLFEYTGETIKYADKEIVRRTINLTKDEQ